MKSYTLRIARPTDNLQLIKEMYINGLGLKLLCEFYDHNNFDGVIIGHESLPYHLEFTHHKNTKVGFAPTADNLLVWYVPDETEYKIICENMLQAGFTQVKSYNPYWDIHGVTFEDIDRYRIVITQVSWD